MKSKALVVQKKQLGKFRGAGFGGSKTSSQTPHEDSDTLVSTQHAVVIDLLSEGPIAGFADQNWNLIHGNIAAAIWFNQSPLANNPSSWTNNFNGVNWNYQLGWEFQQALPGSSTAQDTISVGVTLSANVPYIFSIDDPATTRVALAIRVPELFYEDDKGNIYAYWVYFSILISMNGGGFSNLGNFSIQGKCTSDYVREYIINLPKSANPDNDYWQIQVVRNSPNDADTKHVSPTVLDYYTNIVDAYLMYPYSAVVQVSIDASQLSDIPVRAYRIKGMLIQVPNNYFPDTRRYTRNPYTGQDTGVVQPWTGGFYYAWSNNPAWVWYDMATNSRYGAGEYLGTNIDKWSLYQIAQYCDQAVPDGFGGWEPRFSCNTYIQSQEQAWKVLSDLASVFRGMLYWGQGMVVPVADMPKPVLHNFTCANVIDGRFTYTDAELKNRFSDCEVTYNDPKDFFATKIQSVFDTDMRVRYGYRDSKFTSFGCTSRGQAHRHGEYVLATNKYETETVTFQTGFEAMYLRPGDIIGIVDNYRIGLRQGGRVYQFAASGNPHWVTLDSAIGPFPDQQEIRFFYAQDSPTSGDNFPDSNAAAGVRPPDYWLGYIYGMNGRASNTVYVSGEGGSAPPYGDIKGVIFVIGANLQTPLDVPVAQWRILTIAERAKNLYEISASTYEPDKYNLIDFGIQFGQPIFTRIQSLTYVLPPNNLKATIQATVTSNTQVTVDILLSWEQPPDDNIASYQAWMNPPNAGWGGMIATTSTSILFSAMPGGTPLIPGRYNFRVNSVNTVGITSVPATCSITVPDAAIILAQRISGLEVEGGEPGLPPGVVGQGNFYTYYTDEPVLAWRINAPSSSFEFNSEAPYGAGEGDEDPYFRHYLISVYDADTGNLGWTRKTKDNQHTIQIKKNTSAWGDGKPRHHLTITIVNVNKFGVEFQPTAITIDNPAPDPPTNLTAVVQGGTASPRTVGLQWTDPRAVAATANNNVDIVSVNIYQNATNTFTGATKVATIAANTNVYNGLFSSGTYYFFVTMVDSFGSESTPANGVSNGVLVTV